MKDEAVHYFKLAIKRLENQKLISQSAEHNTLSTEYKTQSKDEMVVNFLLELLKEQVPHEDFSSSTR
ncbi:MAG: hypothetical protein V4736_09600 [Bdellovibrionota bacterium]